MKSKLLLLVAITVAVFTGVLWAFVGVERLVGDHEVGVSWALFIKHRPSLQMRFANPAQHGLEIVPFEVLSLAEGRQFMEFCSIRFGVADAQQCYTRIAERKI